MVLVAGMDACAMAPKTFAEGWATLAAMDRPSDSEFVPQLSQSH
jgi:hypothetical protein